MSVASDNSLAPEESIADDESVVIDVPPENPTEVASPTADSKPHGSSKPHGRILIERRKRHQHIYNAMTKYTVLSHHGTNWNIFALTDCDEGVHRDCMASFGTSKAAMVSDARISTPLPAVYRTVYSTEYRGYPVHVTHRPIVDTPDGSYSFIIRSMYMGMVMVGESPIYLDYMKPGGTESRIGNWRDLPDAISNAKWFIKTQLPVKEYHASLENF